MTELGELLRRPWYDALMLLLLLFFFLDEARMLWRSTRLGWAMTAKCLALALLWFVALLLPYLALEQRDVVISVARAAVIGAVVWADIELRRVHRNRQRYVLTSETSHEPYH